MEELLAKYFAGEATATEIREVKKWRNASEENDRHFLEAKKAWVKSAMNEPPEPAPSREMTSGETSMFGGLNRVLFLKYAVIFILVLGGAWLLNLLNREQPSEILADKMLTHKLPDGSKVTLQAGSKLSIGDFELGRSVILSGRGYFTIRSNEAKPFTITTKSARIQVTGTSFVVNSVSENATEVIVESGSVALYQNPSAFQGSNMMISLNAGEIGQLEVGKRGIRKKKLKDQNYLAWKTGILTFKNTPIGEVALVLEDIYGFKVSFGNPPIRNCRLTADYKDKTSEEVLELIASSLGLTYQQEGDAVLLEGKGCR